MANNRSKFDVKQFIDELAALKEEWAQNTSEFRKLLKQVSQMVEELRTSLKKNEIGRGSDGGGGGGRVADSRHNHTRISIMKKFINLRQEGSLDEYVRKFEALKTSMSSSYGYLTEDYFIDSFIGGLKEEIGHMVEMLAPSTLTQAVRIASKQEEILRAMERKVVLRKTFMGNMGRRGKIWLVCLLSPFLVSDLLPLRFKFIMAFTIPCLVICYDVFLRSDVDLKNS